MFRFTICFVMLLSSAAFAETLTVEVHNIKKEGVLRLAVFDNAASFEDAVKLDENKGVTPYKILIKDTSVGTPSFDLKLPKGTYGIVLYVDVNKNEMLDKSFLGVPTEQFGFSNNPKVVFSAPSYEAVKFDLQDDKTIKIKLP